MGFLEFFFAPKMLRLAKTILQKNAPKISEKSVAESSSKTAANKKMVQTQPPPHSFGKRLAVVSGFGALLYGSYFTYTWYLEKKYNERKNKDFKSDQARAHYEKMEHIDIGGQEFSLVNCKNVDGKRVTGEDFKGKWHLLYFGFTHCPDICPSELEKMTDVLTILDEDMDDVDNKYNSIVPVFITIDPSRDSPANILKYLRDYHPRYLALRGIWDRSIRI